MCNEKYKRQRTRVFLDSKIQGSLMVRVTIYWVLCVSLATLMLFGWRSLVTPSRALYTDANYMLFHYGPVAIVIILMLPIAVWDTLRLSARFVGPFLRLRREMRRLARGEPVRQIRFRNGDFWQEFADEFNAVVARVESLEQQIEATEVKARDPADGLSRSQELLDQVFDTSQGL